MICSCALVEPAFWLLHTDRHRSIMIANRSSIIGAQRRLGLGQRHKPKGTWVNGPFRRTSSPGAVRNRRTTSLGKPASACMPHLPDNTPNLGPFRSHARIGLGLLL